MNLKKLIIKINEFINSLINKLTNKINEFINSLMNKLTNKINEFINSLMNKLTNKINKLTNKINKFIKELINKLINKINKFIKELINKINKFIKELINKLINKINKFINELINKLINKINKFINELIEDLITLWNFLKIFTIFIAVINIYFEFFVTFTYDIRVNIEALKLSKELFISMQETYPIFGKDYWDISSENNYYSHYLDHLDYLSSPDYLNAERVIQIFDDRDFNNSKVVTVFIERIQNYNVRHVITTNEEYHRCLNLFERYHSDMTSLTSDDDKFLFIQEKIKEQIEQIKEEIKKEKEQIKREEMANQPLIFRVLVDWIKYLWSLFKDINK